MVSTDAATGAGRMPARNPEPLAFLSYVHFDDEHEDGRISALRERLAGEVRIHTGRKFLIFQDRDDIAWGQNWRSRIDQSIDSATFLIPVVTPGFFTSASCRGEVERFLERERILKRNDLILPIYYVDHPPFDSEKGRSDDPIMEAIHAHQYVDWRDLRFEPLTSAAVRKKLAAMAVRIRDALSESALLAGERASSERPSRDSEAEARGVAGTSEEPEAPQSELQAGQATRTEPPTHVVDALGRADFITISEAVATANPGDRILVRPGLYMESVTIDKPLEILGDGDVSEIELEGRGGSAIHFTTNMGRVAGLTIRQREENYYAVDIAQGRLHLEDCDITSDALACVGVHGGASPRIRTNRIHDGHSGGIFVYEQARGTIEDNEIFGNTHAGVVIKEGAEPILRRNRINRNGYEAVWIYDGGGGTFEDNDLRDNARGAWDIDEKSEERVERSGNAE